MTGATWLFIVMLGAQAPQEARSPEPVRVDLMDAVRVAAAEVVADGRAFAFMPQARDATTGRFVAGPQATDATEEEDRGFWTMSKDGLTDPAELMFLAASVADIWSRAEVTRLCEENADVLTCDNTGISPAIDSLLTAGVTMGVTGVQRLAKKYWDVDLTEGWKKYAVWGAMSVARLAATWVQLGLANDIRGGETFGMGLTFNVGG